MDPRIPDLDSTLICEQWVKDLVDRKSNKMGEEQLRSVAPLLLFELLRYLKLKCVSKDGKVGPPSTEVDGMWHAYLLCTKEYFRFCETENKGAYLHHDPSLFGKGTETGKHAYHGCLALYTSTFGEAPPKQFWRRSAQGDAAVAQAWGSQSKEDP